MYNDFSHKSRLSRFLKLQNRLIAISRESPMRRSTSSLIGNLTVYLTLRVSGYIIYEMSLTRSLVPGIT